jgi:hypothetical protein
VALVEQEQTLSFFFNYERWTIRGGTVFPIVSIPSLKERQGDFSAPPSALPAKIWTGCAEACQPC